ncbi:SnoaL-like domain-containing protein [Pedococcus dokdonensis]|uniref:SnoaL-like domain-containing protein n=2 Tax=Pedococcus dokdonensis TaxID=443156 RepID=A0A1H0N9L6_9MICO|nr:SnoaL-like domain-containing protein [Pedococcus dokdonensis]
MERITAAQNAHDAAAFAELFAVGYDSSQPAHPGRAFQGREQVLANWTAVFEGVRDFHADLVASASDEAEGGTTEWGEVDWSGRHTDGTPFAMRGVLIVTVRDGLIAQGRLYVEPVDAPGGDDIGSAVEELYRPPEPAAGD